MSTSGPIIITPPPPPPPPPVQRILGIPVMPDAKHVMRKASTWIALVATAVGAYCSANLAAYALTPAEARAAVSAVELAWYARGSMFAAGITALIPLATSWRQKAPQP